jgi:hypothetical protein
MNRFTPRKRAPGTHWIGGWVGPRAVLDAVVKRKISSPRRESNLRTPIVQPVHYSLRKPRKTGISVSVHIGGGGVTGITVHRKNILTILSEQAINVENCK